MPLNWSVKNVKDSESLFVHDVRFEGEGDYLNSKTESLIWFTMVAGLPSTITEESAADWFARISFYEKVHGTYCVKLDEDRTITRDPFTPEDIVRNIGLSTNGNGRKETWGQFVKRVTQHDEADAKRAFAKATKKAEVA